MPHAVDEQAAQDDELIGQLLAAGETGDNPLEGLLNVSFDQEAKADDAIDYEDISDDDLAEEEQQAETGHGLNGDAVGDDEADGEFEGLFSEAFAETQAAEEPAEGEPGDQADPNFDDLFGEAPSSPTEEQSQDINGARAPEHIAGLPAMNGIDRLDHAPKFKEEPVSPEMQRSPESPRRTTEKEVTYGGTEEGQEDEEMDEETRMQMELFAQSRKVQEARKGGVVSDIPPALQTDDDVFQAVWPRFESAENPRFFELLPIRRAYYIAKTPLKPPKPVQPTKVNLDLQQDQEKAFRLPTAAVPARKGRQAETDQRGVVPVTEGDAGEESSDDEVMLDQFHEDETIGGVTWQDLQILCDNWDIPTPESMSGVEDMQITGTGDETSFLDDWDLESKARPTKKRRISGPGHSFPVFQDTFPLLEDPEDATAKIARKIALNLNDPQLLIDIQQPDTVQKKPRAQDFRRDVSGSLTKSLFNKYNISNDQDYDLLKQNHRDKVRNITNNNTLEHSLPAVKLQYPFYKVQLTSREARSFHRPMFTFVPNQRITFNKPNYVKKKKQYKGQDPKTVYTRAEHLSLADNSNMVLLEYSEEYPTMMSNFGMCNRLVNYYRRKENDDPSNKPKLEIGENQMLYPEDQSPFAIFGDVEPGQTVPTVTNAMYRAPVFAHNTKPTDFLVIRNTTGTNGSQWFIRNVENLFVVGQQFPLVQVPGTHSRKVTEAGKRRLKMISYRIYARNMAQKAKGPTLSNDMIKEHLPGSDVAQNRGKMREFMVYEKETQSWRPRPGEPIPDENTMRGWIKPEDICLIDSMQVGRRHLEDAGYNKEGAEAEEEDDEKEGQSLEQQLAPWNTTKNFLEASSRRAMLQLHGEGDPSGRGEAISMIKTSMKGGFKPVGESVKDKLDAKRLKELGGHSYNVAIQQKAYDEAIKKIWEAQKASLSSNVEHSDVEMDPDDAEEPEASFGRARTPQSQYGTPAAFSRRDDESASQFSRFSVSSQKGKVLRIVRKAPNKYGKMEAQEEVVNDPKVIREYMKRKRAQELSSMNLADLKPTGDEEMDARQRKRLLEELARLERNRERRHVREKAKGLHSSASQNPDSPSAATGGKGVNTTRRCANCGQVGHIKTNKKLCPLLNGSAKQGDGIDDAAFGSPVVPPSAVPQSSGAPPASSPS
ncbi:uncharacterized protein K452DRAFT_284930 [Aplosporella prunicola CBS 121167]|uniref:Transcription initiation factor TFIID subunit 1 histone acetyltransferase domain-containing protein n=1 Tax=Aplosporella prunicola CBS 121167 TaxID=1176127 RepID=A0A6A6BP29_9PEZI|nr:uncharacterized protein K452DRAFT_284930 [Aplosporella prunicola CBS 121167]KAF2144607.1 hypothetical protein K452DRAFT_284930 [Aplosporella prunicola CBS 121167]